MGMLRGSSGRKWSKLSNFCFLLSPQISRRLAALEPPPPPKKKKKKKMEEKRGAKGRGFVFFNRKRKRKWKKYFVYFVGNLSRIAKLFFFSF